MNVGNVKKTKRGKAGKEVASLSGADGGGGGAKCYNYGKPGYKAGQCPSKKDGDGKGKITGKCNFCGKPVIKRSIVGICWPTPTRDPRTIDPRIKICLAKQEVPAYKPYLAPLKRWIDEMMSLISMMLCLIPFQYG